MTTATIPATQPLTITHKTSMTVQLSLLVSVIIGAGAAAYRLASIEGALRSADANLAAISRDLREFKSTLGVASQDIVDVRARFAGIIDRIDRMDARLDRLEARPK